MAFTITPELKRAYHLNYTAKPATRVKLAARARCASAIKAGKLVRQPCEKCSAEKSEAHHDDYSNPLDVRWLCRKCHASIHRKSHCVNGHPLTDDNIRLAGGKRQCRQCHRDQGRRRNRSTTKS